jgi:hypothetical protein
MSAPRHQSSHATVCAGASHPPRLLHASHIESSQNAFSNTSTPRPAASKSTSPKCTCMLATATPTSPTLPHLFFFGQTGFLAADTPTLPLESPPERRDRGVYPPPLLLRLLGNPFCSILNLASTQLLTTQVAVGHRTPCVSVSAWCTLRPFSLFPVVNSLLSFPVR